MSCVFFATTGKSVFSTVVFISALVLAISVCQYSLSIFAIFHLVLFEIYFNFYKCVLVSFFRLFKINKTEQHEGDKIMTFSPSEIFI